MAHNDYTAMDSIITQIPDPTPHEIAVYKWVKANRGIVTTVAAETGVSQPFVTDILYKRRNSRFRTVEQRLASLGAPGFEEYSNAITG